MFLVPSTLLFQVVLTATPAAVDLTAIPREISVPPVCRSAEPAYCLMVFGAKADTRVWLVQDGDRLYVDRNGNGDLTETGEMIEGTGSIYDEGGIRERDGTLHGGLSVYRFADSRRCRVRIRTRGAHLQFAGHGESKLEFAIRPQDAPIVHFNGPLTFERYAEKVTLPRNVEGKSYRATSLRVLLGSPGLGEGTFAGHQCTLLRKCNASGVRAQVEYPHADPNQPPHVVEQFLEARS